MFRSFAVLVAVGFAALIVAEEANAYYHPQMGRFVSRDPGSRHSEEETAAFLPVGSQRTTNELPNSDDLGRLPGYFDGTNLYRYCSSMPVGGIDPSGLKLLVPKPEERKYFLDLVNQLCPPAAGAKPNFTIDANGFIKPVNGFCAADKPQHASQFIKFNTSCRCVCDSIKLDRTIRFERIDRPGAFTTGGPIYRDENGFPTNDAWGMVQVGCEVKEGAPGFGDPTFPPTVNPDTGQIKVDWRVSMPEYINMAHELCGHALPKLDHPAFKDGAYTLGDAVIQIENNIRREHNCGCRTGNSMQLP